MSDLNGEEIGGTFYENELEKTNQEEIMVLNHMSNGKVMIIRLTVG